MGDLVVEPSEQFLDRLDLIENTLALGLVAPLAASADGPRFEGCRRGTLGQCLAVADRLDEVFTREEVSEHAVVDAVGGFCDREAGIALGDDQQPAEVLGQASRVLLPDLVEFRAFRDAHLDRFVLGSREGHAAAAGKVSERPAAALACSGSKQAPDQELDHVALAGLVSAVGHCQVAAVPVEWLFERPARLDLDPLDTNAHEAGSVP